MEFHKQRQTILLLYLVTISLYSLKTASTESKAEEFIKKSCKTSMYPNLCCASLGPFADQVQQSPEKLAIVSITFCLSKVKPLKSHVEDLSKKATDPNMSNHLKQCLEYLDIAVDSINKSIELFKDPGAIHDVQIHMSAAMTCADRCKDIMEDAPDGPVKKDVVNRTDGVEKITSISFDMVDLFANS